MYVFEMIVCDLRGWNVVINKKWLSSDKNKMIKEPII